MMMPRLLPITILVMGLLLLVKIVTFAREADAAIAVAAGVPVAVPHEAAAASGMTRGVQLPAGQAQADQVRARETALLEDLKRRDAELDRRQQALEERSAVLDALESRLQDKLTQLSSLRSRIEQLDLSRKQREAANWTGLVKTYQSMKPQDAATIFDALDMHVVLEVLDRMTERKAASILAAMAPERARQATQMLAEVRLHRESLPAQATSKP